MKADPSDQLRLLDVQDIDNQIASTQRARTSIAEVGQRDALENDVRALGPAFIAANGAREDAQSEIARIEDDVRLVAARLAQDIERRDHSSSAKDISGFEHEIATLNTRKEQLEEAELVVMQKLEDAEAQLASINSARAELAASIASLEAAIASRTTELADSEKLLLEKRAQIISVIPADLVALYEKQRARYGIGAALLTRGVSGGSGVALTASDLDAVRHAAPDDVVLCPESSCILVRTNESGL